MGARPENPIWSNGNAAQPDQAQGLGSAYVSARVARVIQVEPEFATRFIQRTFSEGAEGFSPADPIELEGWTDKASGLGGAFCRRVGGEIVELFTKPESVVELSPGRSPDEAILDLHENWLMKRIVLRKTGDVGSIIFSSIELLADAKRKLEEQVADASRAREEAETECARLTEQLKLAQAREFGSSSEQKQQTSNAGIETDSPAASIDEPEPKKTPRLAASGGGRKPIADHLPREPVPHRLEVVPRIRTSS
jgi:hypothetical protein